jgi:hypothetical protein
MARQTSVREREAFVAEHQAGATYAEIADKYSVSLGCVRYWCRRARRGKSLESQYTKRDPGLLQAFDPLVRYGILRIRLVHPHWGPRRIRHKSGATYDSGYGFSVSAATPKSSRLVPRYPVACMNAGKSTSNWALP